MATTAFLVCGLLLVWGSSSLQIHEMRRQHENFLWKDKWPEPRVSCVHVQVKSDETTANLTHFWKSTGFCPPDPHVAAWKWFESESMTLNLAYLGALPAQGIEQVRIHWLLDTITLSGYNDGNVVYNFSHLDNLLDKLYEAGLRPGFELMGNPGQIFTDLENKTQVFLWRDLVMQTARHYIERYSVEYISEWNFETWNEPKHGHFDTLNMTVQGFLNYYDACSEGLRLASPQLKFGGPGGECKKFGLHSYCWALLNHVQNGVSYFTQQTGVRMDFISIHKKGEEPDNSDWILRREANTIKDIHNHFPKLSHLPIYNDEADPLVGWSRPKWWRTDVTYAALIAKVISLHQEKWLAKTKSSINYRLLSNDNGFLSYSPHIFSQRTLLARFQINDTVPPSVQYIVKPAYSVMGLLALLGDQQLRTVVSDCQHGRKKKSTVGVIAAIHKPQLDSRHRSTEWTLLMYNSYDSHNGTGSSQIILDVDKLKPSKDLRFVVYLLDGNHGNPYKEWISEGRPLVPSLRQLQAMRKQEGPVRVRGPEVMTFPLILTLPLPGVILLQACVKPSQPPGQVTRLKLYQTTPTQLLLVWDDRDVGTRCLCSYEVEYSRSETGPFKKINDWDLIMNYFLHDIESPWNEQNFSVSRFYRVLARDLWGRTGPASQTVRQA